MKKALFLVAFLALYATDPSAQTPSRDQDIIPQRSIKLTAEESHTIKEIVKDVNTSPASVDKNAVKIGEKLPPDVQLSDFPAELKEKVSAVRTYKFFKMGNQVVIVHPNDNLVADILN